MRLAEEVCWKARQSPLAFASHPTRLHEASGLPTRPVPWRRALSADFLSPVLYQLAQGVHTGEDFHDVTTGFNGLFAGPGWDEATGWGSIDVNMLANNPVDVDYAGDTNASDGDTVTVRAGLWEAPFHLRRSSRWSTSSSKRRRSSPNNAFADAIAGGGNAAKIDQAQAERAKASDALAAGKTQAGIDHLANAWHKAEESLGLL